MNPHIPMRQPDLLDPSHEQIPLVLFGSDSELQDLRLVLKAASQLPAFSKPERAIAMRAIEQLDQILGGTR